MKCKTYILKSLASPAGGTSPEATSPTTLIIGKVADDPSAKSAIPGTARRNVAGPPLQTRPAVTTSGLRTLDPAENGPSPRPAPMRPKWTKRNLTTQQWRKLTNSQLLLQINLNNIFERG